MNLNKTTMIEKKIRTKFNVVSTENKEIEFHFNRETRGLVINCGIELQEIPEEYVEDLLVKLRAEHHLVQEEHKFKNSKTRKFFCL